MTVIAPARVELADGTTVTDVGDGLDHCCCCDEPVEVGDETRALCGKVEPYTGQFPGAFDDEPNPCIVCLTLLRDGYCPRFGRCPNRDVS